MLIRAHTSLRQLAVIAGIGLLACQGSSLTLPEDVSPSRLEALSGNGQRGTVGTQLQEPLVVRVTDAENQPVPGVNLRFATQVPAAEIKPSLIATDDSGVAAVKVQLGDVEGVQTVEASLADTDALKTSFALIAEASQPPDDGDEGDGGSAGDDDGGNGDGDGGGRGRGRGNGNGNGHDDEDDDD